VEAQYNSPQTRLGQFGSRGALLGAAVAALLMAATLVFGEDSTANLSIGFGLVLLLYCGIAAFFGLLVGGIAGAAVGGCDWMIARGWTHVLPRSRSLTVRRGHMEEARPVDLVPLVRKRMQVTASDGSQLGLVTRVWRGTDPDGRDGWNDEACSRLQLYWGDDALYIPCSLLARVSGDRAVLGVGRAEALSAAGRPVWIRQHLESSGPWRPNPNAVERDHSARAPVREATGVARADTNHRIREGRSPRSVEPGIGGYALCYALYATILVLGYVAGFLIWRQAIYHLLLTSIEDGHVLRTAYMFSMIGTTLGLLTGAGAAEIYLREGLRRGRLIQRYARLLAGLLLACGAGITITYGVLLTH
jgi:hypothetical protein